MCFIIVLFLYSSLGVHAGKLWRFMYIDSVHEHLTSILRMIPVRAVYCVLEVYYHVFHTFLAKNVAKLLLYSVHIF